MLGAWRGFAFNSVAARGELLRAHANQLALEQHRRRARARRYATQGSNPRLAEDTPGVIAEDPGQLCYSRLSPALDRLHLVYAAWADHAGGRGKRRRLSRTARVMLPLARSLAVWRVFATSAAQARLLTEAGGARTLTLPLLLLLTLTLTRRACSPRRGTPIATAPCASGLSTVDCLRGHQSTPTGCPPTTLQLAAVAVAAAVAAAAAVVVVAPHITTGTPSLRT